jgi:predicted DCC family thiol-disulfide oxidoreductase YuxK
VTTQPAVEPIEIIFDGECPFCSAYVRMLRLRDAAGPVKLIDAREHGAIAAGLADQGIDLNQTMAVRYGGATYTGAQAVELLSVLSSESGLANRFIARILRNKTRAALLYPVLRAGRNLTLRILGRPKLDIGGSRAS